MIRESNHRRKFPRLNRLPILLAVYLLLQLSFSLLNPRPVEAQAVGISTTVRLFLGVPSTVRRFSVTEGGPVQDVLGTNYNFSTAQAVVYP